MKNYLHKSKAKTDKNDYKIWKKETTLIAGGLILSRLREFKTSKRRSIKIRAFCRSTIQEKTIFIVPLWKKSLEKIVLHIGTYNTPEAAVRRCSLR